jgi:hypothetical protein
MAKLLVKERIVSFKTQESFETEDLYLILRECIKNGSKAIIPQAYASAFGFENSITGGDFWKAMIQLIFDKENEIMAPWMDTLLTITSDGTLAERILSAVNEDYSRENLSKVYGRLANCLQEDTPFMA